jgi:nicotinate phosphoribosyltransferase
VEIEQSGGVRSTAKFSEAKKTYPGRKQVFRFADRVGKYQKDIIGLEDESFPGAVPLLVPVMRHGRRLEPTARDGANIRDAQKRFLGAREHLASHILALGPADPAFPVSYSVHLEELCEQIRQSVVKTEHG